MDEDELLASTYVMKGRQRVRGCYTVYSPPHTASWLLIPRWIYVAYLLKEEKQCVNDNWERQEGGGGGGTREGDKEKEKGE